MKCIILSSSLVALTLSGACDAPSTKPAIDAATAVDGTATGGVDSAPPALSSIVLSVNYEGSLEGDLLAAAFHDDPPRGPPIAAQTVRTPSFPVQLELRAIEPGTYYVAVALDVPPASPRSPGPEDPTTVGVPIELDGTGDVHRTITIDDRLEEAARGRAR